MDKCERLMNKNFKEAELIIEKFFNNIVSKHKILTPLTNEEVINAIHYNIEYLLKAIKVKRIIYEDLLCDGLLNIIDDEYVIKINNRIPPVRKRFTIAHEIAHAMIKKFSSYEKLHEMNIENLCNEIAAILLIPYHKIKVLINWDTLTISKLQKIASELKVSLTALTWHVIALTKNDGGFIWFKKMGKITNPNDEKLRIELGVFPNSERMYIPKYDSVPENSPIYKAYVEKWKHEWFSQKPVRLNFGSLRGERYIRLKFFSWDSPLSKTKKKNSLEKNLLRIKEEKVFVIVYPSNYKPLRKSIQTSLLQF
jgi:Zn-dependent peptidase ImmA (M78 family)